MKIDALKLAFATAIVFAVAWVICSLFVVSMPRAMMRMSGHMVHADFGPMGWQLSLVGFVYGLFLWSAGSGLIAGATAVIYNRLIGPRDGPVA